MICTAILAWRSVVRRERGWLRVLRFQPARTRSGALLDRLTHHVSILTMNGDSYRLRQSAGRHPADSARAEQNQATDAIIDPDTGEITPANQDRR